jgi:hypothetical protein
MQAIINQTVVDVCPELAECRFFNEWREFSNDVNGHVFEFDTEYFDEFLLLNMPLYAQYEHFRERGLFQLCQLADAMEYFGAYRSFPNIIRAFRRLFWPMNVVELVGYRVMMRERADSKLYVFYLNLLDYKVNRLTIPEIVEVYEHENVQASDSNDIFYMLFYRIEEKAWSAVTTAIEEAIDDFDGRSIWRYPAVRWSELYDSRLTRRFIREHRRDFRNYNHFLNHIEDEENLEYLDVQDQSLSLRNLPFDRYIHLVAARLIPRADHSAFRHIGSYEETGNQWDHTGIDGWHFPNVPEDERDQPGIITRIIESLLE